MKKTEIIINVDPIYFGDTNDIKNVELFAGNLIKNIQKCFNLECDYKINYEGNSYYIRENDPILQLQMSDFIESNWHNILPSY
jgi:hypothetical protein